MRMLNNNEGFTLIEALVAAVVLVIGIFSLYSMQTTAIKHNANANAITTSSTWSADRIEQLLSLDWDDAQLTDDDGNGLAGLDDIGGSADGFALSPDNRYSIYWNTADIITPNPDDLTDSTLKTIRVIVRHDDFGVIKEVKADYYKQRIF